MFRRMAPTGWPLPEAKWMASATRVAEERADTSATWGVLRVAWVSDRHAREVAGARERVDLAPVGVDDGVEARDEAGDRD